MHNTKYLWEYLFQHEWSGSAPIKIYITAGIPVQNKTLVSFPLTYISYQKMFVVKIKYKELQKDLPSTAIIMYADGHNRCRFVPVLIDSAVADPELFLRGGPLTDLRGGRSSHASMIPYIFNQIFPTKGGAGPPSAPPGSAYVQGPVVQQLSFVDVVFSRLEI